MSLLTLALSVLGFFTVLIGLFNLLPDTTAVPLPPEFASSLTIIFGYVFAWKSVFTVLNTLFYTATLGIGLEVAIFLWRAVRWTLGLIRGSKS